uniref:Uncharacterized protein n=1 Tax=Oncorhynchus kisutch TaxID=8019 RepID=A0A8C7CJP3_ONCKI
MRQATGHSSDNQRKNATQAGSVVFLSNPLMSDIESDWSPIHDAAYNGRVLTLRNLIAQGTCVNLATLERVSPLHGACLQGHTACAKLLIENGANHGASPEGYSLSASPIHQAAAKDQGYLCSGHPECIESQVHHGADVDQHTDQSGSPLYTACTNQHLSTVKKLLQLGASVNSSKDGDSPLNTAARLSNPELMSVLLEHGADCSSRDTQGKQPPDLASCNSPVEKIVLGHRGGS